MTMAWSPLKSRKMALRDWRIVLERSRVDPYLAWADASAFAGFAPLRVNNVSIAFEFKRGDGDEDMVEQFRGQGGMAVAVSKRFGVASLPIIALPWLLKPKVQKFFPRFELGMPLAGASASYTTGISGRPAPATSGALPQPLDLGAADAPVVAVIDDGCPFAHTSLRRLGADGKWHTRIKSLWFQEDRRDYGFDAPTLDRWLNAAGNGGVDEAACYRSMRDEFRRRLVASRHGDPRLADRWWQRILAPAAHGAHVLDVFAGAPNPLARRYGLGQPDDVASKAPILFVQLPRGAIDDTTGLSMNVCVLEALAYIAARVDRHPTVINLSFGSLAGPHNGSSMLESAMDDFLEDKPHIKIVLPAGNGYDYLTHASVTVGPDAGWREMPLRIFPDDPTDTFIELWYGPCPAMEGLSAQRPATGPVLLDVELVAPDGTCSGPVGCNDAKEASVGNSTLPSAAIVHQSRPPTSPASSKCAALIALAATQGAGPERGPAPHGVWTLRVRNRGSAAIKVDAWIERDDSAFGSGRSRSQAVFLSRGELPAPGAPHAATTPIDRRACLNSIAHGSRTTVVGGSVIEPREHVAHYSASGPGRLGAWPGPEYVAPCEESPGVGLQAAGTRSGSLVHMNGTSVAAPIVARLLLNSPAPWPPDSALVTDSDSLRPPDHPDGHLMPDPVLRRGRGLVRP